MPNNFSKPIEWATYQSLKLKWPEWLVTGLLPKDSSICLHGKRGHGKTLLTLDLALCIATGTTWNDQPVSELSKINRVSVDDGPKEFLYALPENTQKSDKENSNEL